MPTDLERQLPRFAEVLDREAPAISVEEILGRQAFAVDVETSTELAATVAALSARRHVSLKIVLAAAAVVVLAFALAAVERVRQEHAPADVPPPTVPTPSVLPTSGAMWPQSTPEEVRAAQERADNGDPDYTWQVDARLVDEEYSSYLVGSGQVELVDRFLREVLGWEAYVFNTSHEGDRNAASNKLIDQRFLRCAPGRTNPLYPPQPGSEQPAESCAPTIDDLHFESVSLDLAQLGRLGSGGIWVVNEWRTTVPFEQTDPAVAENVAIGRVGEFLAARVAGTGAEGHVRVIPPDADVPLLYATTAGAPYERYEIERIGGPRWPNAYMTLAARLFADGDATVVEQHINWSPGDEPWLDIHSTRENGQPIELSYISSDGEVTVAAPSTWEAWLAGTMNVPVVEGDVLHEDALKVWTASVWRAEESFGSGERIELVDPVAYDAWCAANGGSPLLTAPADAASIAQQLIADPNFVTTAPVPARVGGLEAMSLDVSLAPGGQPCGVGMIEISRWIHGASKPGWRMRLYLVDLPEGMSAPTLAITVVAPEDRFDAVIAETAPIIESIEFHPKAG